MAQKERASLFPLIAESIKNVSKDSSARFLREIIMKKNFFSIGCFVNIQKTFMLNKGRKRLSGWPPACKIIKNH
jgi:hypothetical protein